jgi:hypothetical protein
VLAGLLAPLVLTSAASAGTVTVTRTFSAQGETSFVVPPNVTSLAVEAVGGSGTDGGHRVATPGTGAEVTGMLPVTPGQTLYLEVDIGGGDPSGGGYSAVALCPRGTVQCTSYAGLPWYLTQPIIAAGGGAPGELPSIGIGANNPGGNGGLLGEAGGAAPTYFAGGGGGASLTAQCAPGEQEGGNGATDGTRGLPEGIGGSGGEGVYRGGGGGGGYFGGCGGGGAGNGFSAGGGGGGGASFVNNPGLTDYLSSLPTVTDYSSDTPAGPSSGSITLSFSDPNGPTPLIDSPRNIQVGALPIFTGVVSHNADDDPQFTLKIEQTHATGGSKGSEPVLQVATETAIAQADGSFTIQSPVALASGTYQAEIIQSLIGGGNQATGRLVTFTVDATPPLISLSAPTDGTYANSPPAMFTGVAGTEPKDSRAISVTVHLGSSSGPPVATAGGFAADDGSYSIPFTQTLPDGTYEAVARQLDNGYGIGTAETEFVVDTVPPSISLSAPAAGAQQPTSPTFSGIAGTTTGDLAAVSIDVYSGSTAFGAPIQVLATSADGSGGFSTPASLALAPGTYTAVASQLDRAGNEGTSGSTTFTVPAPPGPGSSPAPGQGSGSTSKPGAASPSIAIIGSPSGAAGRVRVTLACRGSAGSCIVIATFDTVEHLSGSRVMAVTARPGKRRAKLVVVAGKRVTIETGKQATVTLALNRTGRTLLGEFDRLPVRLRLALGSSRTSLTRSLVVHP